MRLSVVIPCFNEEASIPRLRSALIEASSSWTADTEFILVDDGSTDRTLMLLSEWEAQDERVRVCSLGANLGQAQAIRAGICASRGDFAVIMDADLQDPPEFVSVMLEEAREGVDVIAALRLSRDGESFLKRLTAWCYYRAMAALLPFHVTRDAGEFRLISRRCIDEIKHCPFQIPIMRLFLDKVARSVIVLPYARPGRLQGASHYTWSRMIALAFRSLAFVPLQRSLSLVAIGAVQLALASYGHFKSWVGVPIMLCAFALLLGGASMVTSRLLVAGRQIRARAKAESV